MPWIAETLRAHPELAFFLALGLGHALGRVRIGGASLGPVLGVLLTGIAVGQVGVAIPSSLSWTFFSLFLFGVGYEIGPQFFRGLGRGALPQVVLTALFAATSTGVVWALARTLGFDAGATGGLLAGGLTDSAALGAAGLAVEARAAAGAARDALRANLTVAFAVTYLPGVVVSTLLLARLAPRLLRVDLAAACHALERELGVSEAPHGPSAHRDVETRAFRVPPALAGTRGAALERAFLPERFCLERVRHAGGIDDAPAERVLAAGDHVALTARREALVAAHALRTHEVEDAGLLDFPVVEADVVVRGEHGGLGLAAVERRIAESVETRGVYVRRIRRGGHEIPRGGTLLRGDVVTLAGARRHLERVAARLGRVEWPDAPSDLATLGLAIALGGLLGLLHVTPFGVSLGLSLPVGVLLGSLVAGWLRATRPVFGHVPEPVLRLFESLGLTGFLALVGLSAGPDFARGLRESGAPLLLAGSVACLIPHLVTLAAGRLVFGMHPGLLLGLCAGAGTAPAALAAVQEAARSKVPTLGYGIPFAIGHVLLAFAAGLLVTLHGG